MGRGGVGGGGFSNPTECIGPTQCIAILEVVVVPPEHVRVLRAAAVVRSSGKVLYMVG